MISECNIEKLKLLNCGVVRSPVTEKKSRLYSYSSNGDKLYDTHINQILMTTEEIEKAS